MNFVSSKLCRVENKLYLVIRNLKKWNKKVFGNVLEKKGYLRINFWTWRRKYKKVVDSLLKIRLMKNKS